MIDTSSIKQKIKKFFQTRTEKENTSLVDDITGYTEQEVNTKYFQLFIEARKNTKPAADYIKHNIEDITEILSHFSILKQDHIKIHFVDHQYEKHYNAKRPAYSGSVDVYVKAHNTNITKSKDANVYVNINDISALVHELGHVMDARSDGNFSLRYSARPEFNIVKEIFTQEYEAYSGEPTKLSNLDNYYKHHTEIFAFVFQEHFNALYPNLELAKQQHRIAIDKIAKKVYEYDEVRDYFNTIFLGTDLSEYTKDFTMALDNLNANRLTL